MSKIKALDPITVTKIAAGEVIDRPVSIVKELIENSIDSGATTISVLLEDGGKKRIQISDNGSGISPEDLPLAPQRHTTSKITELEDIYGVNTFGFRGEALASIAHVAKLEIHSKTETDEAYCIKAHQDTFSELTPISHPKGTTMIVLDLFFDMPVRRNFLKTDGTELSKCVEVVTHFALIHPTLNFKLMHNNVELLNTTGISDAEPLIMSLLSKTLKNHLVPVNYKQEILTITGYISDPSISFPNRAKQVIAVNNRLVKSPIIQSALQRAYKDLIVPRRHPLVILNIQVEGDGVDVNIHPQKQDIKFAQTGLIFDHLPKAIQGALNDFQPFETLVESKPQTDFNALAAPTSEPTPIFSSTSMPYATPAAITASTSTATTQSSFSYRQETAPAQSVSTQHTIEQPKPLFTAAPEPEDYPFLQVFETYIVVSTPEGLYILDQHAVHERILYEQFKVQFEANTISSQPLLVGEILDVTPSQYAAFNDHEGTLRRLGFSIELFGPDQLIVRELPAMFTTASIQTLVLDILTQFETLPNSSRDLTLDQKEVLQLKACKAAIKAGKRLSEPEVKRLIKDFLASPNNFTCPHGRPLCLQFTKSKLESLFLRA